MGNCSCKDSDDLGRSQLTGRGKEPRRQEHLDPKMGIVRNEMNKKEYKLVRGFLRGNVPLEVVKFVYFFFYGPLRVIRKDNFCVMDPEKRIFEGIRQINPDPMKSAGNTFFKLTKPLNFGIAEVEIECINNTGQAISIGIISELYAKPTFSSLFEGPECGESYHMILSTWNSTLQHNAEPRHYLKPYDLSNHSRVKFILNFYRYEISFFVKGVQVGSPMQIKRDNTYYAAFEYVAYSPNEYTHPAYRLCETASFP